jgi:hypothetical protein
MIKIHGKPLDYLYTFVGGLKAVKKSPKTTMTLPCLRFQIIIL